MTRIGMGLMVGALMVVGLAQPEPPVVTVAGEVTAQGTALGGAWVRFKGTTTSTTTDDWGRFAITGTGRRLTAAAPGHFIAGAAVTGPRVNLSLRPVPAEDHPDYTWVDPTPHPKDDHRCANCHQAIFEEWRASGHARSATGSAFLDLYAGSADPRRPKPGWNLRAQLPEGAAVCAACHAPSAEPTDPGHADLRLLTGVARHGVHCDYCHKIAEAFDHQGGRTHGRFAHRLLRPTTGQLFFGPLDDVDRGDDVFAPWYKTSRYCAACHEGVIFGIPVYTTHSEWLVSPAARAGKQCQDCHQAPTGRMTNIAPGHGGIERAPATLASHRFPGGTPAELCRCLDLRSTLQPTREGWRLTVSVTARGVGHRVPTGFIDRHLLLTIEARDGNGHIVMGAGPELPRWATQDPVSGGQFFGKRLADAAGRSPVAFWHDEAYVVADTRLQPEQAETAAWVFPRTLRAVGVRLVYRRFHWQTAADKGWADNETLVGSHRHLASWVGW